MLKLNPSTVPIWCWLILFVIWITCLIVLPPMFIEHNDTEQSLERVPVILSGMSITIDNTPTYTVEKIIVTLPDGERIEMDNGEWKEIKVRIK